MKRITNREMWIVILALFACVLCFAEMTLLYHQKKQYIHKVNVYEERLDISEKQYQTCVVNYEKIATELIDTKQELDALKKN